MIILKLAKQIEIHYGPETWFCVHRTHIKAMHNAQVFREFPISFFFPPEKKSENVLPYCFKLDSSEITNQATCSVMEKPL